MKALTIMIVALLVTLAACEKPNLEDTGGGYGEGSAVPDTSAAVPDTSTGAEGP